MPTVALNYCESRTGVNQRKRRRNPGIRPGYKLPDHAKIELQRSSGTKLYLSLVFSTLFVFGKPIG
jgi:hypothetical protein